jgi:poly-gamma-glutamate synthesis protein (capsule biosynthesis protein)
MAGSASVHMPGRPGVNGLRLKTVYHVQPHQAQTLQEIAAGTKINAINDVFRSEGYKPPLPENTLELGELMFEVGTDMGVKTSVHPKDLERIKRAIYDATLQADYIIISIHCHEQPGAEKFVAPEFLEVFARACIDSGAHAVVGHGPHVLRGVEVYKNRPIFYSLGDFVLQNENITKAPADYFEFYNLPPDATMHDLYKARSAGFTRGLQTKREAFETIIPSWEMDGDKLVSLNILAVELGFGLPRSRGGWPAPAKDSSILEQLAKRSKPYGTDFKITGNRAEIVLG